LKAVQNIHKNRIPGPDKIENDKLKITAGALTNPLTTLFNKIIETGKTPDQWNLAEIILLHRRGSRRDINHYRPISLASNISNIFLKIIENRIYPTLDSDQLFEQFRKCYSTTDHIHTLNQIIEKTNEYGLEIYIMFIDFNKVFDSIYHNKIWEALQIQGVSTKIINILKEMYKKAEAYIRLDRNGNTFPLK